MESHPLNMAHQQHRRADAHLLNFRYDEAIECHQNAAELLLEAKKSTTSSVAMESIALQHNYHVKQMDLIKCKKEQYERVKRQMADLEGLCKDPFSEDRINDSAKIRVAIYRTTHETDSLIQAFLRKNMDVIVGKKEEKSQETIAEELQILNRNLHSLVDQLVFQVEVGKDENNILKEKLEYLEKERAVYLTLPSVQSDVLQRNFPHVNIGKEEPSNEDIKEMRIAKEPQSSTSGNTLDETGHPHLDLSALKDPISSQQYSNAIE